MLPYSRRRADRHAISATGLNWARWMCRDSRCWNSLWYDSRRENLYDRWPMVVAS